MILIKWKGCSLSFRAMGVCQICMSVLDSELVQTISLDYYKEKGNTDIMHMLCSTNGPRLQSLLFHNNINLP